MIVRRVLLVLCSFACLAVGAPGRAADGASQAAPVMPRYADPLAGLYPAPASGVPRDVPLKYYAPGGGSGNPGRNVLTMAVVPGANFHKVREYMAAVAQQSGDRAMYLQLQPVLARAVQIIKARYPWLEVTNDLASAEQRNVSLTLVLDIRSRIGTSGAGPTGVQIDVVAFDDRHKPVARFIAEGHGDAKSDAFGFPAAAKQALDALTAASKQYFN